MNDVIFCGLPKMSQKTLSGVGATRDPLRILPHTTVARTEGSAEPGAAIRPGEAVLSDSCDETETLRHGQAETGRSTVLRALAIGLLAIGLCLGLSATSDAQTPDPLPCVAEPTPECLSREALAIYPNAPGVETNAAESRRARDRLPVVLAATGQDAALDRYMSAQTPDGRVMAAWAYAASGQVDRILAVLRDYMEIERSRGRTERPSKCHFYAGFTAFFAARGAPAATRQINDAAFACLKAEWGMFGWLLGVFFSVIGADTGSVDAAELLEAVAEADGDPCTLLDQTAPEVIGVMILNGLSAGIVAGLPPADHLMVLIDCQR